MIPNNQLEEWQKGYSTLKQENAALRVEIVKQCRLNGMGAERELKLITQNKDLKAALKVMHDCIEYNAKVTDCGCEISTQYEPEFVCGLHKILSSPEVKRALEYLE